MRDYITPRALRIGLGIVGFFALLVLVLGNEFNLRGAFVVAVVAVALLLIVFIPSHHPHSKRAKHHFRWRLVLVGGGIVITLIVAAYIVAFLAVQPPQADDFYAPPRDMDMSPGALLRTEPVTTDIDNATAHKILYTSRDIHDQPIAVSGLVLTPQAPPPDNGFPVIAWAHGTSGIARQCAPSLAPQVATTTIAEGQKYIDAGYMIVATDYQGLGTDTQHPYLIGKAAAQNVLDSVRAVQDKDEWSAKPQEYVVAGHSQGGHSTIFTAQHAETYAPDLTLLGAVAESPPTNLSALLEEDSSSKAGRALGSLALVSWSRIFDDAKLHDIAHDAAIPAMEGVAAGCYEGSDQALIEAPEAAVLSEVFLTTDPTTVEPWQTLITDNSPQPSGITAPLFVAQGGIDPAVDPDITKQWATQLCQTHPTVIYKQYPGVSHLDLPSAAIDDVLPWVKNRFEHKPALMHCG